MAPSPTERSSAVTVFLPNSSFGSSTSFDPSLTLQRPVVEKQSVQLLDAESGSTCQTTTSASLALAGRCPKSQTQSLGLPSAFSVVVAAPVGQLEATGPAGDAPTGYDCRNLTFVSVEPLWLSSVAR